MSPVLFTLPGADWEVSSYGFFLGLALIAGWIVSLSLAGRDRLPAERLGTSYVVAVAFGLLAGRLAWLFVHPEDWTGWASIIALQPGQGGFVPFVGVTAALVVAAMHVQRMRVPVLGWLDVLAPALALGLALERIGALLAGFGHGRVAQDFPFALRFPMDSPAFAEQRRTLGSLLPAGATESLPVYPTQIIAMLVGLVALAVALRLRRSRTFGGQIFIAVATIILVGRSFVELPLSADRPPPQIGPATPGQAGVLVLVLAMLALYRVWSQRAAAGAPGMRPWEGGRWSPAGDDERPKGKREGKKA